jgi:hypothetical protein
LFKNGEAAFHPARIETAGLGPQAHRRAGANVLAGEDTQLDNRRMVASETAANEAFVFGAGMTIDISCGGWVQNISLRTQKSANNFVRALNCIVNNGRAMSPRPPQIVGNSAPSLKMSWLPGSGDFKVRNAPHVNLDGSV